VSFVISHSFYFIVCRVRDKFALINAMSVDPLYLQHKHGEKAVDYRVEKNNRFQIKMCLIVISNEYFSIGASH
jgi:hypothetical protein